MMRQYETRFFRTTFHADWDGDFRTEACVATARFAANGDLAAHHIVGEITATIGGVVHETETRRIVSGAPERTTTRERALAKREESRRWARRVS